MCLSKIKHNFIAGLNIKSLALRDNSIEELPADTFDSLPNLEHLDISDNLIPSWELFSFGSVPSLKSLILDNNVAADRYHYRNSWRCYDDCYWDSTCHKCIALYQPLRFEVEFPEVTYLSLRNIFISSISNYWASQFPKVTTLDVSNNKWNTTDDFFEKLPETVRNLTMENVGLTSLRIKSLKKITIMNLNLNSFEVVGWNSENEKTLCLRNLDKLESLFIASCSIQKIETDAFEDSQKLAHLDISNNSLSEVSKEALRPLQSLTYFDLSQNPLTNVPDMSNLKNLETLKMNKMKNDLFLINLWNMSPMPNIRAISLQSNNIKHIPADFFTKFPGLQEIDLSNNQLNALPPGPWQTNLKRAYLGQNRISNIGNLQLAQAKSLVILDLKENNITDIQLSAVKQLPDDLILKI